MTISFWLILLAVLAYGLLHTLLASLNIKAQARYWFGSKSGRLFRLAYNFIAVITLLPILVLPVLLIDQEIYRIGFPWVIGTLSLQVLAILVVIISVKITGIKSFMGLRQLFLPEDTSPPRRVTGGFYRLRTPMLIPGLRLKRLHR